MLSDIVKRGCRWLQPIRVTQNLHKPLLGLDINSTALKLVALSQQSNRRVLERYLIEPLPDGIIDNGALPDLDKVATVLRRAWEKLGHSSRDTAIAIPTTMAFYKTIQIPIAHSNRLKARIEDEIRQLVGVEPDEVSLDYQILDTPEDQQDKFNILVCACRRETVEERVAAVELAGLTVVLVDVECFAHITALEQALPASILDTHQALALLDINDTRIQCQVIRDRQLIYYRSQRLTDRLTDTLIQEIQRFLHSFLNTINLSYEGQINGILLSGNRIPVDLSDAIKRHTGIPAQIVNPFTNMLIAPSIQQYELEKIAPSLLAACGLALRRFDP